MALMQASGESELDSSRLSDPFDWNVEEVIYSLCNPNSSVLHWGGGVYLPDPEGFEKVLREEQVNGETLLTSVTMDVLRNDLGIKALGARSKILNTIRDLQDHSSKYQQTQERNAVRESRLSSVVPMSTYNTPHMTSPMYALRWTSDQPAKRIQSGETPLSPSSLQSPAEAPPEVESSSNVCQKAGNEPKSSTADVTNQPQESSFIDGNGRQRRRLAPTIVTEASSSVNPPVSPGVANEEHFQQPQNSNEDNHDEVVCEAQDQPPRPAPVAEQVPKTTSEAQRIDDVPTLDAISNHSPNNDNRPDLRQPKRVKPTLIAKVKLRESSPTAFVSASHNQAAEAFKYMQSSQESKLGKQAKREVHQIYLNPAAAHVDEIFYSDIALGEVAIDEFPTLTTEQQEMSFNSTGQLSNAQRLWINSRMKYFFKSTASELTVKKDGREIGIIPYPERLGKKHHPLSMTVLSRTEDSITKFRANRLDWMSKVAPTKASNIFKVSDPFMVVACDDANWDALEKWNHVYDDKVLPAYGDSDSEDYDMQTYAEIEAENRATKKPAGSSRTPKLTADEVDATIDEAIRQFCEEWQTKKAPKLQHKAWRLWAKAKRHWKTEIQIEDTVQRLAHLEGRILNLCTEIRKGEWFNVGLVMKQCNSMQPSIFEREENEWRLSVLKSRSAPPKLPTPTRKARETKSDTALLQHDEGKNDIMQSSADDEETDDDLNDFIVNDELDGNESQDVPEIDDVNMADEEDIDLSDTLINTPVAAAVKKKEESQHTLHPATKGHAEPAKKQMVNFIDLTQASDSLDSPPSKAIPTRITTPPIFNPDEDSDAWFQNARSVKPEFKLPPKLEDVPIVYLNDDSDSETRLTAPVPPPTKLPPLNDVQAIKNLSPTELVEKQDRKRLLIWLVAHTNEIKCKWIYDYVYRLDMAVCLDQVKLGLREMRLGKLVVAKNDQATSDGILQIAAWYVGWTIPVMLDPKGISINHIKITLENDEGFDTFHGFLLECLRHYERSTSIASTPSKQSKQRNRREEDLLGSPLLASTTTSKRGKTGKAREEDLSDSSFLAESSLKKRSKKGKSKDRELPDPALSKTTPITGKETAEDDDTSDSMALADLRNNVPESQETLQKRDVALQRLHENTQRVQLRAQNDARRKVLWSRLAGLVDPQMVQFEVILNPGKLEDQDLIRLNPEFGRGAHLKPHQIEGLQFMWREITADQKDLQGCLLAQTMGLGKTMQVIALLVAISDTANSPIERLRDQVPEDLRSSQTLVLCPPALIENWWDEFLMWPPAVNHLGELRKVSASLTRDERISEILTWQQEGGVLLMGYHTFRDLLLNRPRSSKADKAAGRTGLSPLNEEQHLQMQTALLEKPSIVVADEAHEFKNLKSNIGQTINRIRCKSRIALTGSPLSNNLGEYFATIDWIAPGYLGTESDFRSAYELPIQHGLHEDASPAQYRDSRKRLKALELELEPKVHRADLSALHGNLYGKSEFVVRVPLTPFQDRLYRAVISGSDSLLEDMNRPKGATVWAYLATLQLICNHPDSCRKEQNPSKKMSRTDALKNGNNGARVTRTQTRPELNPDSAPNGSNSEEDPIMDNPLTEDVLSVVLRNTQQAFNDLLESNDALHLSNKMQTLMRIIELSGAAGDKVLVFSHRHGTLNYIEDQLNKLNKEFTRIDGTTPVQKRQRMTKSFNEGTASVCLISTKAGGQGLNMFGANRVVILDAHFNPMWEQQAIGRAYRIGQQKHVYIYRLTAAGTFEEELQNQALFKEQLATRVLEKKNPHRIGASGARQYLFFPKETEKRDVTCFAKKDELVLDHLLADGQRTPIISITPSETFYVDDGQDLTAQEFKEAQQMLELEKLRRRNPAQYYAKLYPSSANRSTQILGDSSSSRPYPSPSQVQTSGSLRIQQAEVSGFEDFESADQRPWHAHGVSRIDGGPLVSTAVSDTLSDEAQLIRAIAPFFSLQDQSKRQQVPKEVRKTARTEIYHAMKRRNPAQPSAWELSGKMRNLIDQHAQNGKHFRRICECVKDLIEKQKSNPDTVFKIMTDISSNAIIGPGVEATNPIELDADSDASMTLRQGSTLDARAGQGKTVDKSQIQGQKSVDLDILMLDKEDKENEIVAVADHDAAPKVDSPRTTTDIALKATPPQESHIAFRAASTESKKRTPIDTTLKATSPQKIHTTPRTASTDSMKRTPVGMLKADSPQESHTAPRTASNESKKRTPAPKRPHEEGTNDESSKKKQKPSGMIAAVGQQLSNLVRRGPPT